MSKNIDKPVQAKRMVDTATLFRLHTWLGGYFRGAKAVPELGSTTLESLLHAIYYCRGDYGYTAERDQKRAPKNDGVQVSYETLDRLRQVLKSSASGPSDQESLLGKLGALVFEVEALFREIDAEPVSS